MSADEIRSATRASWEESAGPWGRNADRFGELSRPVSEWMLDGAGLAPGQRVLELACGPGDVGLMAARRIAPDGVVVLSDVAEAMIEIARERAKAAGVENVEFRLLDAEWIDVDAASLDAVLSRWGLMFPVDPEAAFRECRRVLKPDGRIALAAWDDPAANAWHEVTSAELFEQGLTEPPPPGDLPGPFRFTAERLRDLLDGAGFLEVRVEPLPFTGVYADTEDFWAVHSELSVSMRRALGLTNERGVEALRAGIDRRLEAFSRPDGTLEVPYRALMASATA